MTTAPAPEGIDLGAISRDLTEAEPGFWVGPAAEDVHYDASRSRHWKEAEDASGWHRHRAAVVVDAVRAHPPAGTVLDLGAGNGYVSRALREAGIDAVPTEPVEEAARTAYARGLRPVVWSTLEGAAFAPGSLPAVGMFDVLEHLDDDVGQLREVHRLLAPGGRLYLTVPKHHWLWSAHDVQAGHQRRYSTTGLLDVVRAAGFEVEHHTSLFAVLVAPMAVRKVLPARQEGVADPTGGGGRLAGLLDRALRRERTRLARRPQRLGTSLLVVARRA
jgi:SAM-dependent methyltransferase